MNRWVRNLEVATNIAVLGAFLLVGAVAAKRFWEPSSSSDPNGPTVGATIHLKSVDWSKSDQNLVLALSTGCHFCSESADFYHRLVPAAASNGVRVLAVLPQPISEGRSYLEELGLDVPEVLQSPLSTIDVSGTPTVLLLDRQGRIRKAWVGKLGAKQEQQVISGLF